MTKEIKFSTVLGTFGNHVDRFVQSGYKGKNFTLEEMFNDANKVEDLSGVELVGTWHINEENIDLVKKFKERYNLEIPCIIVDIFAQAKWGKGSFTSNNPKTRREAIDEVKKYMDISASLNCDLVDVWFGQDGYDYSFQSNFIKAWNYIIDGITECAEYRSDIRIGIEYKPKEPRTHCYIGTIGKTLTLVNKVEKENVGVLVDVGHALYAYENMAETIALCKLFGDKLFHLHLNDNYRYWDDDMLIGSVHLQEYLELLYWLKKIGYKGWYSLDIYPYREGGIESAKESIEWLKVMVNAVNSVEDEEIEKVINKNDAVRSLTLIRKMLFK